MLTSPVRLKQHTHQRPSDQRHHHHHPHHPHRQQREAVPYYHPGGKGSDGNDAGACERDEHKDDDALDPTLGHGRGKMPDEDALDPALDTEEAICLSTQIMTIPKSTP